MQNFLELMPQTILNGLTLGSVYALIALGYSMVYGILRLLNFAHGDIYMIGAYLGYGVFTMFMTDEGALIPTAIVIVLMLVVAMMGTGIVSMAVERFAYRPLRYAPRIAPLISALGVSFILQNLVQISVGARPLSYGSGTLIGTDHVYAVGDLRIHASHLLVIGLTFVLMMALTVFIQRTRLGRAMRAVSMDLDAAEMMGVNVNQVILITFFIGAMLAGAGGVLVGIVFFSIRHTMGFLAGLKGFTAAVIGGIGSMPGAALGGLVLGMAEAFSSVYISVTFKDAIAFLLLVAVLLLRPSGILGRPIIQKV
ncbi:branched-chain amino acid ABC transporter permease LivH [Chloroflexi bacterium TSY]|nr:branched-chain amino acid ABC transporter permease LivH [Chloroflexi bacterium TSY]